MMGGTVIIACRSEDKAMEVLYLCNILRRACYIVNDIEVTSDCLRVCACVCARARARVCVCVCSRNDSYITVNTQRRFDVSATSKRHLRCFVFWCLPGIFDALVYRHSPKDVKCQFNLIYIVKRLTLYNFSRMIF